MARPRLPYYDGLVDDFIAELAAPRSSLADACSIAVVTPYQVYTWRQRSPNVDWRIRLALLDNGSGKLPGGSPAMLAELEVEAATPPEQRRTWEQVQAAIEARGEVVKPATIHLPTKHGRPVRDFPYTYEHTEKLLDAMYPGKTTLVQAAKIAGIPMSALSKMRDSLPWLDWAIRLRSLASGTGRRLPGGDPAMRLELEWEAQQPPVKWREWEDVKAAIDRRNWNHAPTHRPATTDTPSDLMGGAPAVIPAAAPGSLEENF